jgi:hypothetical protein
VHQKVESLSEEDQSHGDLKRIPFEVQDEALIEGAGNKIVRKDKEEC